MLTIASLRWPHVLLFWLGVVVLAVLLAWVEYLWRGPWRTLLPYPGSWVAFRLFVRGAFAAAPMTATGFLVLPACALVLTLLWLGT